MKLWESILDLLYPPRCQICHKFIDPAQKPVCNRCMDKLPEFEGAEPQVKFADRCVATLFYKGDLRESFHRYKFSGLRWYADQYGKWLAVTVRDKLAGRYDLVTWVPVSAKRRRERGYDQAELLCRALCRELGTEPVRLLEKVSDNPAQSGLDDPSARRANVANVYRTVDPAAFAGKRILLIDDIVTTGATLGECCRVLLTAGAESVVCAVLATPQKERKG